MISLFIFWTYTQLISSGAAHDAICICDVNYANILLSLFMQHFFTFKKLYIYILLQAWLNYFVKRLAFKNIFYWNIVAYNNLFQFYLGSPFYRFLILSFRIFKDYVYIILSDCFYFFFYILYIYCNKYTFNYLLYFIYEIIALFLCKWS